MKNIFIAFFLLLSVPSTVFSQNIELTVIIDGINCFGDCNGAITVNATGGVPPYTYSLENFTTFQSSNIFSNLCPGIYNVIAKDATGNSLNSLPVILTEPAPVEFLDVITQSGNETSGVVEILPSGGTPPYLFSIDGAAPSSQNIYSDLSVGNHEVTVSDANGCTIAAQITVEQLNVDNSLVRNGNLLTSNLTADTYQWINSETQTAINGETNQTFQAEQPGKYRVEMTLTVAPLVGGKKKANAVIKFSSATYEITEILSVNSNTLDIIKPYPNPAHDYLIVPKSSINKNYVVYSLAGKKLFSGKILTQEISIEEFSTGIYFIQVEGYTTTKFIKR